MGVYLGVIGKKNPTMNSVFFNFKPLAEITNEGDVLTAENGGLKDLPLDSKNKDINLSFEFWNRSDWDMMEETFHDGTLMILEFSMDNLMDNLSGDDKASDSRYRPSKKLTAIDLINANRVHLLKDMGLYYGVFADEMDFVSKCTDEMVEIEFDYLQVQDMVVVNTGNIWAGPYEVDLRDYDNFKYIRPKVKEHKYAIKGWAKSDVDILNFYEPSISKVTTSWRVIKPKKTATTELLDVISDEQLLEGFASALGEGGEHLGDTKALLSQYNSSFVGSGVSDSIRTARLKRLEDILCSKEDFTGSLQAIAGSFCKMLLKTADTPEVQSFVSKLLQEHSNEIASFKSVSDQLEELREQKRSLQQEISKLEKYIEERKEEYNNEVVQQKILELNKEYSEKKALLDEVQKKLALADDIEKMSELRDQMSRECNSLEEHKNALNQQTTMLEDEFNEIVNRAKNKMVSLAFDGFMANKLLQAASQWEGTQEQSKQQEHSEAAGQITARHMDDNELVDYLCRLVQSVRPGYSKNVIVNIALCVTQGFLTVFSGEPGSGKTSICNILASVLGVASDRFVSVSVEKGWTSKRDFVGYYNPISKVFDKSNRAMYEALRLLNLECQEHDSKRPYVVLLDEANLSPMEYYWSDFMNVCDAPVGSLREVNLGESYVFKIPQTLRFLATINNDHTTEQLSPRLIDRAWIICLPTRGECTSTREGIAPEQIQAVLWEDLERTFGYTQELMSETAKSIYDEVCSKLKEVHLSVSPRCDRAIRGYWSAAQRLLEDEGSTDAQVVALDFALSQKILPKVSGNGEAFGTWLGGFRELCGKRGLCRCDGIAGEMIERGNQRMKYYQFFY